MIIWKNNNRILAGTTLRNPSMPDNNNMALHATTDTEAVLNNRKNFCKQLNITMEHCVLANQTHSANIKEVTAKDLGKGVFTQEDAIKTCDALYTKEKNICIGVFTADCVPILLYDPIKSIICAIHSGWKGTTQAITTKALQVLMEQEGCNPKDVLAYIGPSIAYNSLEVGLEVIDAITQLPFNTDSFIKYKPNNKAMLDNVGLNKQMLLNAGILPENITIDRNDTFLPNEVFFSYRRDKACGRHFSYIYMK